MPQFYRCIYSLLLLSTISFVFFVLYFDKQIIFNILRRLGRARFTVIALARSIDTVPTFYYSRLAFKRRICVRFIALFLFTIRHTFYNSCFLFPSHFPLFLHSKRSLLGATIGRTRLDRLCQPANADGNTPHTEGGSRNLFGVGLVHGFDTIDEGFSF
jgi:hypothetical protein